MARTKTKPVGRPIAQPWAIVIQDAISGGPASLEDVIRKATKAVPPGRAFRKKVTQSNHVRKNRGRPAIEFDDLNGQAKRRYIEAGARIIVQASIRNSSRYGRLEIFDEDGTKMVRLGPNPWPVDYHRPHAAHRRIRSSGNSTLG